MKILIIHQYYLGQGQPGGSRFNELAQFWREAGHGVSVIAGDVNYATGRKLPGLDGGIASRRDEQGINVWRCHVPTSYNRGYLGRMWAFLGFAVSSSFAITRCERPDVIIATSPPLTVALTGWWASLWHRRPLVFEVRDLWPESAITTGVIGKNSALARLLFAIERTSYRRAALINVLTPAFEEDIVGRGLAPRSKIVIIPNGADLDLFSVGERQTPFRLSHNWGDRYVALYAGAHGKANCLMQLVDAADLLQTRKDILLVCVGDGPDRLNCEQEARRRGLTNIEFLGAQAKETMNEIINSADAGLAVLQRNPTFLTVYPNKAFDYMACGRPTVLAIDGVARKLVCDDANAGLFAEPENPSAIAAAICRLADDRTFSDELGTNGRRWVENNASRRVLAKRYSDRLSQLVTQEA